MRHSVINWLKTSKILTAEVERQMSSSAQRFQAVLQGLAIQTQAIELPQSTRTAKEAAEAIGCKIAQIAKSLIFRRLDANRPVLVIASGANRVDEEVVSDYIGTQITMADAEFVRASTGYAIGGVPPFGHIAPIDDIIIDQDLLNYEVIWAAAGTPRSVFPISPEKLVEVVAGHVRRVTK
jgi:prolyl-tRNA editing enzyme YbaK/EbsC (Cys-tRNA(Pro) deacylase)